MYKMYVIKIISKIMLVYALIASFIFLGLTGCDDRVSRDNYLPYMVTEVGSQVTLTFIGRDEDVSPEFYEIKQSMEAGAPCNLRSTHSVVEGDCSSRSNVMLGNVVRLTSSSLYANRLLSSDIDCIRCGNVDLTRLEAASSSVLSGSQSTEDREEIQSIFHSVSNLAKLVGEQEVKHTVELENLRKDTEAGFKRAEQQIETNLFQTVDAVSILKRDISFLELDINVNTAKLADTDITPVAKTKMKVRSNPFSFLSE